MSKFTAWCTPCPECDFREYGISGNLVSPLFHESGDKCPKCKADIKIIMKNQGSPLAYAEAVKV